MRTLIIVAVTISVLVAATANRFRQRKAAIDDIQAAGGTMGSKLTGPEWLRSLTDEKYFREPVRVSVGGITGRKPTADAKAIRELLKQMKQFGRLTALDFRASSISDSDLVELKDFGNLEVLRLNDTKITDSGLKSLAELTHLQSIWLEHTEATEAGILELKAALPNCQIRD